MIIFCTIQLYIINSNNILSWVSIGAAIGFFGLAWLQAWYYYKMSNEANTRTERAVTKINEIVIKLETINKLMNERLLGIIDGILSRMTQGVLDNVSGSNKNFDNYHIQVTEKIADFKKELSEEFTESLKSTVKEFTDTMEKQTKAITDIKQLHEKSINKFEKEVSEISLRQRIIQILSGTSSSSISYELLFEALGNNIPINKLFMELQDMREKKIINFDEVLDIYPTTLITLTK